MKKIIIKGVSLLFFTVLFAGLKRPEMVFAAEASVTFGSEAYEARNQDTFPVGVYIQGDEGIGDYHVELKYDNKRLEYVSGATSEENGILIFEGNMGRDNIRYRLLFRTLSGGNAGIQIVSADIIGRGEEPEEFEVTLADTVFVTIEGEDTVGEGTVGEDVPEDRKIDENGLDTEGNFHPEAVSFTDVPLAGLTELEEQRFFIVNLSSYEPDEVDWTHKTDTLFYEGESYICLTDAGGTTKFLYLMDGTGNLHLYAYGREHKQLYPVNTFIWANEKFYFMSPYAALEWPNGLTLDLIQSNSIVYAMNLEGNCDFYKITSGNQLLLWNVEEGETALQRQTRKLLLIFVIALLVMVLAVAVTLLLNRGWKQRRRKKRVSRAIQALEEAALSKQSNTPERQLLEGWNKTTSGNDILVISIQHVTMRYRIAMHNVSGVKEYIIQMIKHQISHRELLALDDVTFNIFKGEVVGIIGTNGSGKSTLLKIVSGALHPSAGKVLVNRKKIQLLTLGTGFDAELTARENVYLNGAIIGYTKEFLDEKYEEIVRFAELEDFMEEKVKNFSSGMVSRLGFAIATVGAAGEILILDEVLSVGDEFFRKKSMERIQEMIHGGSTVLMVSHGMSTILENCTKVAWIEKGVLRMLGEPKVVCEAYRKMEG